MFAFVVLRKRILKTRHVAHAYSPVLGGLSMRSVWTTEQDQLQTALAKARENR